MHSDPMSSFAPSLLGLLFLVFLALLLLGALALFIYSIVAKQYWLTILMLLLPVGIIIVLSLLFVGIQPNTTEQYELTQEAMPQGRLRQLNDRESIRPEEVSVFPITDEPRSDALPLTADIYPSFALCGQPLAFQIAERIRLEKRSENKFAVTFAKEKRRGDLTRWKPPKDFTANFRNEFVKQFTGSTVGQAVKMLEEEAQAESASGALQPLEIKLSFKPQEDNGNNQQIAGAISARWTTRSDTRAAVSIDFVDKPWVVNFDEYSAKSTADLAVGFSQRLARSPAEATTLALKNAGRQSPVAPNQIVDRFPQKLSLPYGELWQEFVLVDRSIPPSLVFQGARAPLETRSRGFPRLNGLILTAIGLITIGVLSNLLTQGYYRQNIKHTVITGVAVVFGFLILVMFVA